VIHNPIHEEIQQGVLEGVHQGASFRGTPLPCRAVPCRTTFLPYGSYMVLPTVESLLTAVDARRRQKQHSPGRSHTIASLGGEM
jgi:hypothetical protein